jgi:ribonucleoside-diphosphate reductase alpha chain
MAQPITLPDLATTTTSGDSAQTTSTKTIRKPKTAPTNKSGLSIPRLFTTKGTDAYDMVTFEKRVSKITEPDGTIVFEMKDVEVPNTWSQLATDIVCQKYFRKRGVPETGHEVSAKQVMHRVAVTIREFGEDKGYFKNKEEADNFEQELKYLTITQRGAFNSPVWFNCGLYSQYKVKGDPGNWAWNFETHQIEEIDNAYARPQCSACFIQKVEDSLMGIFDLAKNEAKLFKYGSGTGSNFSNIRSRFETLSGGGVSSGLMSFLEVLDRGAGAIKSGGTTRRAAKMVTLDVDHPEILDFVNWKVESEKKAKALIDAGYSADWRGEAYKTVSGQNSNNSVRVSDEFMKSVEKGGKFSTIFRTTGEAHKEYEAQEIFDQICYAAWSCADPGLQFDTTINEWHTCPNTDKIYGSNPCSEYMFLDNSACNLASINLVKFLNEDGSFDVKRFRHACRIFFIAQDILVDLSSYPTEEIAKNSHDYRPLGLGYANLGTLLMMMGLPYDSEEGRSVAAAITAMLHCRAFSVSAEMANTVGTFDGYEKNKEPFLKIMNKHRDAAYAIDTALCPEQLYKAACEDADNMLALGEKYGYRNAQATVLAPTGTIGLLMDCDTTGVEPEFSLVKWKKLAGGGHFKIINGSIAIVLDKLGYNKNEVTDIINYVLGHGDIENAPHVNPKALGELGYTEQQIMQAQKHIKGARSLDQYSLHISTKELTKRGFTAKQLQEAKLHIEGAQTIEGAPHLKDEHLAIFDCANKCGNGSRYIEPLGHVKMMGAVQPFLSGAISKTVNIPNEATEKDIKDIYFESWKLGLKAVALYRDGSKHSQALSNQSDEDASAAATALPEGTVLHGARKELPAKRKGLTTEVTIAGQKLFLRTGEYDNGKLGEIFIDTFKEGASYRSLLNCFAVAISIGLQYGVPLEKYVDSFTFTRFEPSGFTSHPNIRTCTSIVDFIFRTLGMEYLGRTDFVHVEPEITRLQQVALEQVAQGKIQAAMLKEANVTIENNEISEYEEATNGSQNALTKQLQNMMGDAPMCTGCGHITVRNASCYKCLNCGNSMGCS